MAISKKRLSLLRDLESIVGNECYNGKIRNWGPHGQFYGEGREFRYPITFTNKSGERERRRFEYEDLPTDVQMTGRYVMGANELSIMRSLDKIVRHPEAKYSFKV